MNQLYIPNPETFKAKIQQIKEAGISKLHIVSDFDRTLTGQAGGGQAPTTSWSIFKKELGERYAKARQDLYNTYYPIERDNTLDAVYRSEQMSVWWRKHLDLLVENNVDLDMIKRVLEDEKLKLRGAVDVLFNFTSQHKIPFLIFSAGIGDAIRIYLEMKNLMTDNVHILSNFFQFDAGGKANGFQKEVVHTFNKTELLVKAKPYVDQIVHRPNCILLGDSLHDATMTDGMPHSTVLKIGFLNGEEKEREEFATVYDALLEEDTNISSINDLLLELIHDVV
jgi:cytosolic 5'-nucleotidase 3